MALPLNKKYIPPLLLFPLQNVLLLFIVNAPAGPLFLKGMQGTVESKETT